MFAQFEKGMIHLNANMDKLESDKALINEVARVLATEYGFDNVPFECETESTEQFNGEYFLTIAFPVHQTIADSKDEYRQAKATAIANLKAAVKEPVSDSETLTEYFEVVAVIDGESETETLYGSFERLDCFNEIECERAQWKEQGYKQIRISSRLTTDKPDPEIYNL